MTVNVKLLAASVSPANIPLYTFEIEIPRIILSELNTHKQLARNAQSSRAIPIYKQIQQVKDNPYIPTHWGRNMRGMQAFEECLNTVGLRDKFGDLHSITSREDAWDRAKDSAIYWANAFAEAEYHKQIVNRLLEPFMHTKVILSGTEWNNFFNLRIHKDAEPNIRELAVQLYEATLEAHCIRLQHNEWHLPYIVRIPNNGKLIYTFQEQEVSLEDAQRISAACIAQVSYRNLNTHPDVIDRIHSLLLPDNGPIHGSVFEHLATPFEFPVEAQEWQKGESHRTPDAYSWSAQYKGWCQYRKLIPNENSTSFTYEDYLARITAF